MPDRMRPEMGGEPAKISPAALAAYLNERLKATEGRACFQVLWKLEFVSRSLNSAPALRS
jgi:hypothetical protein